MDWRLPDRQAERPNSEPCLTGKSTRGHTVSVPASTTPSLPIVSETPEDAERGLSLLCDTGGEFTKQADSEPARLVTMADVGAKALVSPPFGPSRSIVVAISTHPNTSPPVSKGRESQKE